MLVSKVGVEKERKGDGRRMGKGKERKGKERKGKERRRLVPIYAF